jgi:hypothetical protein
MNIPTNIDYRIKNLVDYAFYILGTEKLTERTESYSVASDSYDSDDDSDDEEFKLQFDFDLETESESKLKSKLNLSELIQTNTLNLNINHFYNFIKMFEWTDPINILISSIAYLEVILKDYKLICNKISILWIFNLISIKYIFAHDNEQNMRYLSNMGGFMINDFIKLEKIILKKLDCKLEIPEKEFKRLISLSEK